MPGRCILKEDFEEGETNREMCEWRGADYKWDQVNNFHKPCTKATAKIDDCSAFARSMNRSDDHCKATSASESRVWLSSPLVPGRSVSKVDFAEGETNKEMCEWRGADYKWIQRTTGLNSCRQFSSLSAPLEACEDQAVCRQTCEASAHPMVWLSSPMIAGRCVSKADFDDGDSNEIMCKWRGIDYKWSTASCISNIILLPRPQIQG